MIYSPLRLNEFRQRISWGEIENANAYFKSILGSCVSEDLGTLNGKASLNKDITSRVCSFRGNGLAQIIAREKLVICGLQLPKFIISAFACSKVQFLPRKHDGDLCEKGEILGELDGPKSEILTIERTLLNFLQRLSGVATRTAEFVDILNGTSTALLDTRKTTPGLRILEKYATACGGSFNHRFGLFDRILIKDNHLAAAGIDNLDSFRDFLIGVKERSEGILVEVEIDELSSLECALNAGVDAVLLDNFNPKEIAEAVAINQNRAILEASGGVNMENLRLYAEASPHFISTGSPVHGARWMDISLDWKKNP